MIEVTSSKIRITRGDSGTVNLTIYEADGVTPYTPTVNDKIYLTIKDAIDNNHIVLQKEFNNNQIALYKSDTILLNFGKYFFDVRLEDSPNYDTILTEGEFIIERGTANHE